MAYGKKRKIRRLRQALCAGARSLYSGCVGKVAYGSKQEAEGTRQRHHWQGVCAYHCPWCGRWHLGNQTRAALRQGRHA